jgi:hypothetical protein
LAIADEITFRIIYNNLDDIKQKPWGKKHQEGL